jgi:hypothetical protein
MRKFVWTFVAATLLGASSAAAEDCHKLNGFTIDLKPVGEIGYLMPLGIADTPRQFVLDIGAAYTKMDETIADQLKLPTKLVPREMIISDDAGRFTRIATAPTIKLGPVPRANMEILIGAHRSSWGPADGAVAINAFYGLDMELDLAHNRLGLYLPRSGCAFEPFWPAVEWGNADYRTAPTGGVYLPMALDDKSLIVTLDPTETRSYMSASAARALFGIAADDPRLVPVGAHPGDGKKVYRFPFKALSAGHNVTVHDPEIYIIADVRRCGTANDLNPLSWDWGRPLCFGSGDLKLGSNLLKKLHFFFSFKDKKVYFTLAEPPPTK